MVASLTGHESVVEERILVKRPVRNAKKSVASLPALGPWARPAERGPSLESRPIYRVSLTVDLCEVKGS